MTYFSQTLRVLLQQYVYKLEWIIYYMTFRITGLLKPRDLIRKTRKHLTLLELFHTDDAPDNFSLNLGLVF